MGFGDAIRTCIAKATTFEGRARRPEFWWFYLFMALGNAVAVLVDMVLFWPPLEVLPERLATAISDPVSFYAQLMPVTSFWFFLTILPLMAVGVRRMHDRDKPGWIFVVLYLASISFWLVVYVVMGDSFAELMRMGFDPEYMMAIDPDTIDALNRRITILNGVPTLIMAALIIYLASEGTKGPNRYGEEPAQ